MGMWNNYANKVLLDSYIYSCNVNPIKLDKRTGVMTFENPKKDNIISDEIKALCMYELSKELEQDGFESKTLDKWVISIKKGFWSVELNLEYSLPYSEAIVYNINKSYKHSL